MKSSVLFFALCTAVSLSSAEQRTSLEKMDLSGCSGLPSGWLNNQAVCKNPKFIFVKDGQDAPFLRYNQWIHLMMKKVIPVSPADRVIVKVTARGSGYVNPSYYVFSYNGFSGAINHRQKLTPEWKTYTVEKQVETNLKKNEKWTPYPKNIRPLIEAAGNYEIRDYSLQIIHNPILSGWMVDVENSKDLFVADPQGNIVFSNKAEFCHPALKNVKVGDTVSFTFNVMGTGKVFGGIHLYDQKYRPGTNDKPCGLTVKSIKVQTSEWKKIKVSCRVDNVTKDGKRFFVNRLNPMFRIEPAPGYQIALQSMTWDVESEQITVGDF